MTKRSQPTGCISHPMPSILFLSCYSELSGLSFVYDERKTIVAINAVLSRYVSRPATTEGSCRVASRSVCGGSTLLVCRPEGADQAKRRQTSSPFVDVARREGNQQYSHNEGHAGHKVLQVWQRTRRVPWP